MAKTTNDKSALFKLEHITDDPRFEGFAFVRGRSLRGDGILDDDFMPNNIPTKGRKWTAPRLSGVWVPQPVAGRVRKANDYPCVNMSIPAFSRRAVDALRDYLETNGELLPLVTKVGEYFAFNVTKVADVLNHQRSKIEWLGESHVSALEIGRYECIADRLKGLSIFRLVEECSSTFVTQCFVDRVFEHGLQGFHFIKVWPLPRGKSWRDEDQPVQSSQSTRSESRESPSPIGNTVVLLLATDGARPTKLERQRIDDLMNDLDSTLYDPTAKDSEFLGSVHGHEHTDGAFRVFLTCPNADLLVRRLRPLLRKLNWRNQTTLLKRYGEFDDPDCLEKKVVI